MLRLSVTFKDNIKKNKKVFLTATRHFFFSLQLTVQRSKASLTKDSIFKFGLKRAKNCGAEEILDYELIKRPT